MNTRHIAAIVLLGSLATSGCKSTGKNSEVMINTSTNRTEHVAAPSNQKSTASQLGAPTLSGREADE